MFRIIPEQVFTFPISVFTALSTLFICGGFISVDMFTSPLKEIVQFIPFRSIAAFASRNVQVAGPWSPKDLQRRT
ncbi:MAG: hypothetical protein P8Y70_01800 [Candidatus Lokiarchaeota archaeon]